MIQVVIQAGGFSQTVPIDMMTELRFTHDTLFENPVFAAS